MAMPKKVTGMVAITHRNHPDMVVQSQYGNLPWRQYLEREKERLEGVGRRVEVRTVRQGTIVLGLELWANKVA